MPALPKPLRAAAGSGSASRRRVPEQGFVLPAAVFSGALLWLQNPAVWQALPFTLWGLSKVQRRKCQQRGKGAHCAPDLPVPGTMQPVGKKKKKSFLFIQPSFRVLRPGQIKFLYRTLLSGEMRFSPCPGARCGEGCGSAEGDPPPHRRCRQIRLLPGHGDVRPGWCPRLGCAVTGREKRVGAKPALQKALGSLQTPGSAGAEDLICVFPRGIAGSGPRIPALQMENSQIPLTGCANREMATKRAVSQHCSTWSSPAPLPPPWYGFPALQQGWCWAGRETEAAVT